MRVRPLLRVQPKDSDSALPELQVRGLELQLRA